MNRIKRNMLVLSLLGAGLAAGPALADASNLQSALAHLQAARNDLEQGGKSKDSHQKDALQLVGQAIEQVRKGIDQEQKKRQKTTQQDLESQEKATQQEQKKTKN